MNPLIVKAESVMNHHLGGNKVTPQGKRWLEHALDPFKDFPVKCEGYPDTHSGNSVVQVIKQTRTITAPAGIVAGQTWSCNLFLDQVPENVDLYSTIVDNMIGVAMRNGQGVTPYANGGLVVRKAIGNGDLTMTTTSENIPMAGAFWEDCETRVLSQGFEVHNTTDELHKGGSVCYYRIPFEDNNESTINLTQYNGITACIPTAKSTIHLPSIPKNSSEALLLPGSVQTEAREGAYIVGLLSQDRNPAKEYGSSFFMRSPDNTTTKYCPLIQTAGTNNLIFSECRVQSTPFLVGGSFFTGLTPETTLTVNVNWIVERFIKANGSNDLLTLSTATSPYDPKILELYSLIARELVTGVPVSENGIGSWVMGIADTIAKYAGPVLSGIGQALNNVQRSDKNKAYREKKKEQQVVVVEQLPRKTKKAVKEITIVKTMPKLPSTPHKMPPLPKAPNVTTNSRNKPSNTNSWVGNRKSDKEMLEIFTREFARRK